MRSEQTKKCQHKPWHNPRPPPYLLAISLKYLVASFTPQRVSYYKGNGYEIISKRVFRCVTPRHDLGTCCNYSSIEINRIHDTLELDRAAKKRTKRRKEFLCCLNIVYRSAIAIQIEARSCEKEGKLWTSNQMENFMLRWVALLISFFIYS